MLLMNDNYDSFTYNLVQYFGELGQKVNVYRNDEITVDEIENLKPRHVVISPGPCTPNEAGISLELIEKLAGKIPILGVCLGFQAIENVMITETKKTHIDRLKDCGFIETSCYFQCLNFASFLSVK